MIPHLCAKCPAKIQMGMKITSGVKKAIAIRLGSYLEELQRQHKQVYNSPYWAEISQTRKDEMKRVHRKQLNALKIVIWLLGDLDRGPMPNIYNKRKSPDQEWPGQTDNDNPHLAIRAMRDKLRKAE